MILISKPVYLELGYKIRPVLSGTHDISLEESDCVFPEKRSPEMEGVFVIVKSNSISALGFTIPIGLRLRGVL